jgi:hypothetical protein
MQSAEDVGMLLLPTWPEGAKALAPKRANEATVMDKQFLMLNFFLMSELLLMLAQ